MTSIRTLAAVLGLLSFCACAAAQSVTRTGGSVNFTHTGVVTRVPVGLPLVDAKGSRLLFRAARRNPPASNPGANDATRQRSLTMRLPRARAWSGI